MREVLKAIGVVSTIPIGIFLFAVGLSSLLVLDAWTVREYICLITSSLSAMVLGFWLPASVLRRTGIS